ncbi:hypothetical protein KBD20_02385 [Candidatus Saccharibacteria bacterium]|nr:hypothetical protein [Candidatus Saccharibacteria bacterium]
MKKYIQLFIPKASTALLLLILPVSLTVYFVVSQYSNKFIVEQNVNYLDVQSDFVRTILFENRISELFVRFSDFALWGMLAAVILVSAWFIGASRTAAHNHMAVEDFRNFKVNRTSWHGHFAIEVGLKTLLVIIVTYLFMMILAKLVPQLIQNVGVALSEYSLQNVLDVVIANAYIYCAQLGIVIAIKAFKHIQID